MTSELPCPTWCDRAHLDDPNMDPVHQRLLETVPVVMVNRHLDARGELVRRIEAAEFEVATYQYIDIDEVWILIADGGRQQQRIEVSVESARRLQLVLERLLKPLRTV